MGAAIKNFIAILPNHGTIQNFHHPQDTCLNLKILNLNLNIRKVSRKLSRILIFTFSKKISIN